MSSVLAHWQRLKDKPFGRWLFARIVCWQAPYFGSIHPRIESLEAGRMVVRIRQRRSIQNHIGTIHAIALCNGAELAAGVGIEATIPDAWRWIPKTMTVRYLAKATREARLEATITLPDDIGVGYDCVIPVVATDPDGTRVFEANITMWVTPRKR